jgi:hypothetical protein
MKGWQLERRWKWLIYMYNKAETVGKYEHFRRGQVVRTVRLEDLASQLQE